MAVQKNIATQFEPVGRAPTTGLILGDFHVAGGKVYLRKTGNHAAIDRALFAEIAIWLAYHLMVRLRGFVRRLVRGAGPTIFFTPDVPHPRYMVRTAAIWGGMKIAQSPQAADAAFFFEDATVSEPPAAPHGRHFNFACHDISKSRVAQIFEQVFGYPLAIDPLDGCGPAVEKSEANGVHDGRIVHCPCPPRPGRTYQRLVDTIGEDGLACDLRTHCIGGEPVIVWIKRRTAAARFLPPSVSVSSQPPEAVFCADELAQIRRFLRAMGADWCGLDILRDRTSGRIYIVDVNKTDAGPIISLPLRQKLASTDLLAKALAAMIRDQAATPVSAAPENCAL